MKQLATIGIVVLLLIGTAVFFSMNKTDDTKPVVTTPDQPKDGSTNPKDGPTPITKGESAGTLTLKSALSHGYLLPGTKDVYTSIDVEAVDQDAKKRPPLNLAVVIDRSGSMSGQKMSSAKAAAKELLSRLGDEDRFAVVSYSGDARVDYSSQRITPNNRQEMIRAIDRIRPRGATNISDGFNAAQRQVRKWAGIGGVNRIILISDGRPTSGLKDNRLIDIAKYARNEGTSVSTIGVGLDYNENIMTGMAKQGAGNYYFVDQPHQIHAFLSQEIAGLTSIVARKTNLVVKLAEGVQLAQLRGFPHTRNGDILTVDMGEFAKNERKNLLLQLNTTSATPGLKPIVDLSLSYQDELNEKPAVQMVALSSVVTDDAALSNTEQNVEVVERLQAVEIAAEVEEAMNLWDRGDSEKAASVLQRSKNKIKERSREFKFKDSKKYDAAAADLSKLEAQVKSIPASEPKAKRRRKKAKTKGFGVTRGGADNDLPSYAE